MTVRRTTAFLLLVIIFFVFLYPSIGQGSLTIKISLSDSETDDGHLILYLDAIKIRRAGTRGDMGWTIFREQEETILRRGELSTEITRNILIGRYDTISISISNASLLYDSGTEQVSIREEELKTPFDLYVTFQGEDRIELLIEYNEDLLTSTREFEGTVTIRKT